MRNNNGFSHILILFVVVIVLGAVGFAGYRVYSTENSDQNTVAPAVQNTPSSNELQNGGDVKALEEDVKATDLDAELNSSELDANLNELQ